MALAVFKVKIPGYFSDEIDMIPIILSVNNAQRFGN